MNAASAAGDLGKADGGRAAAAAWVQGAAQSASRAAAAARAAGAAAQINSTSTIVNGNVGTQININQGGDFQLCAGSEAVLIVPLAVMIMPFQTPPLMGSMSLVNTGEEQPRRP